MYYETTQHRHKDVVTDEVRVELMFPEHSSCQAGVLVDINVVLVVALLILFLKRRHAVQL